jgi:hypothetical protein
MMARHQTKRARALAMVRKLHRDCEAVRRGRSHIMWCPVTGIIKGPADIDVLAFAAARGWLELSPDSNSVRVTELGRRAGQ